MPEFFTRGGPIMWPLLGCSLVAIAVTIERAIFWWRDRLRRKPELVEKMFSHVEAGACEQAISVAGAKPDTSMRVLLAGLSHREHGLVENMQVAASEEIDRTKRGMGVLDTIITMAPLLGILGTVTGIIQSFDLLGASEIGDPRSVISGISQALITTAGGLSIALITLIPFNYLIARVERAAQRLEQVTTQFEAAYKKGQCNASRDGV